MLFHRVNVVENIHSKTIILVALSYLSLIAGFNSFNFDFGKAIQKQQNQVNYLLKVIITIVVFSFLIRYVDLFFVREMSFFNNPHANRILSVRDSKIIYIPLIIASVLKSLYFFPVIIIYSCKLQNKFLKLTAFILLFLPLVEALLKGTRKPFFDIAIILAFTILLLPKIKYNTKNTIIALAIGIFLMWISNILLFDRVANKNENTFKTILSARYNDFLEPNKCATDYILNQSKSEISRRTAITLLHLGQYTVHGFFELDQVLKEDKISHSFGNYTFGGFRKLFNYSEVNPSPREYIYISAFGGLFLDFGWVSLIFWFLFGIFQKVIFYKAIHNIIWRPLLIYLLIINVFLLMFNYMRGSGIYPFISMFFLLILFNFLVKNDNKKSFNS